jgi:hypothetical protein
LPFFFKNKTQLKNYFTCSFFLFVFINYSFLLCFVSILYLLCFISILYLLSIILIGKQDANKMLLKRIFLESLNDIYIVTRCPLTRWQMIWGCCIFFFPHHRIRLIRDLTMDKLVNRWVYCNRHEQLPIPEHLSSLLIHREFVLFMCIYKFWCFVGLC